MTGCTLCDLSLPDPPVTDPDVDGEFCCRGCLAVARRLDGGAADVDPGSVLDGGDGDGGRETSVGSESEESDGAVAYLSVDGMHCATCERFLETTVADEDGVREADASYATDTMRVVYDPGTVDPAEVPGLVSGVGYRARPRGADHDDGEGSGVVKFLVGGGFFGMMTMLFYALFVYPQHFGFEPVVSLGPFGRLYLLGQLWLFATVVLFYTGFPVLRGAYVSLRAGQPNMDLLVALAATSAYLYSSVVALTGSLDVYFDVSVAIVLVVTAGNYYEDRIKRRAVGRLSEIAERRVEAARTRDGETIPVGEVAAGTELLVRPGERVPVDGTVREGVAAVDEALVTGESLPETKRPGDDVVGGSVVTDAPLIVAAGADATSTLDRIVDLLWEIQSTRSGVQRLADRLATLFVPAVTVLAAVVGTATLALGGGPTAALLSGLTVLIVSCPCALGLATPLAVAAGVRQAAEDGVVVASDAVFETLPDTDVVALDKTGTLTSGEMAVTAVHADDETTVLRRAAALERYSAHPVADAIVEFAAGALEDPAAPVGDRATDGGVTESGSGRGGDEQNGAGNDERDGVGPREVDDSDGGGDDGRGRNDGGGDDGVGDTPVTVETKGVVGTAGGERTVVGHPDLLSARDWRLEPAHREAVAAAREEGRVPVVVGWDGQSRGVLVVGDEPREAWDETVEALADRGCAVVVLTGDEGAAAERFRAHPLVEEVFAGVPPDGKAAAVERLRRRGRVAMVGDGSNDAPALAAADVGIALARGTELAADAADAVVTGGRLRSVTDLFDVADTTRRRIRGNLGWAFLYNAVAIPLAATGLLNPLFAALAMATSSALVVANSSRRLG
jgi:Cu2+-exporting ATPase